MFHDSLVSACNSNILLKFYNILYDQHKRYRNIAREVIHTERNIHAEHTDIYEAALAKDIKGVCESNEKHIRKNCRSCIKFEKRCMGLK